jgi:hypothetical protein
MIFHPYSGWYHKAPQRGADTPCHAAEHRCKVPGISHHYEDCNVLGNRQNCLSPRFVFFGRAKKVNKNLITTDRSNLFGPVT